MLETLFYKGILDYNVLFTYIEHTIHTNGGEVLAGRRIFLYYFNLSIIRITYEYQYYISH